jgi:hypothetical protein
MPTSRAVELALAIKAAFEFSMLPNLDARIYAYTRLAEHMDDGLPCSCHWSIMATLSDAVEDFRAFLAFNKGEDRDIIPLSPPDSPPGEPQRGD